LLQIIFSLISKAYHVMRDYKDICTCHVQENKRYVKIELTRLNITRT